ncbi:hypothetical protein CYMTET_19808 [Cymbomonas tetramitiformis]|uniref:Uncharacterized protein n=1 Tax=Cymbomonas tetramitiformis TaxID=36881 RepID=A0AAE0L4U8_9CHLO|nr:hypothetical protein CYMTET_19808 [Cymbomonas tetramitiformis]
MDVTEGVAYNPDQDTSGGTWMKLLAFNCCGGPRQSEVSVTAWSPFIALLKHADGTTILKVLIAIERLCNKLGVSLTESLANLIYDHDRAEDVGACKFFFHQKPDGEDEATRLQRVCLIADDITAFCLYMLSEPNFELTNEPIVLGPRHTPPPFTIRDFKPPPVNGFELCGNNNPEAQAEVDDDAEKSGTVIDVEGLRKEMQAAADATTDHQDHENDGVDLGSEEDLNISKLFDEKWCYKREVVGLRGRNLPPSYCLLLRKHTPEHHGGAMRITLRLGHVQKGAGLQRNHIMVLLQTDDAKGDVQWTQSEPVSNHFADAATLRYYYHHMSVWRLEQSSLQGERASDSWAVGTSEGYFPLIKQTLTKVTLPVACLALAGNSNSQERADQRGMMALHHSGYRNALIPKEGEVVRRSLGFHLATAAPDSNLQRLLL